MRDRIGIGLIGLGTVGTGVARLLTQQADLIRRRLGVRLDLVRVADRHPEKAKTAPIPAGLLIADPAAVITDPAVEIVVEVIGGIEPARTLILSALRAKRPVVTANKALLAMHGEEIFSAAAAARVDLGFEASVAGGIPIVKALKEGLAANEIQSISGIINGTANYILTTMARDGRPFAEVLDEARRAGYAEADPTLDVEGSDSAHKLAILTTLAFGVPLSLKQIYTEGITRVTLIDLEYARALGFTIKLMAIAKASPGAIEARVHPTMIPTGSLLADVGGVYNAIYVVGHAVGETLFYGLGAGQMPTASAVVADLMDIGRNLIAGTPARVPPASFVRAGVPAGGPALRVKDIEEIRSRYYLRVMAADKPGVLSAISGILGRHHISIASVIQKDRHVQAAVPVVMLTHEALEQDVRLALEEINAQPFVAERATLIRVESPETDHV